MSTEKVKDLKTPSSRKSKNWNESVNILGMKSSKSYIGPRREDSDYKSNNDDCQDNHISRPSSYQLHQLPNNNNNNSCDIKTHHVDGSMESKIIGDDKHNYDNMNNRQQFKYLNHALIDHNNHNDDHNNNNDNPDHHHLRHHHNIIILDESKSANYKNINVQQIGDNSLYRDVDGGVRDGGHFFQKYDCKLSSFDDNTRDIECLFFL